MDPFDTARLLPGNTVAIFLDRSMVPDLEVFAEEEALLPASVSSMSADRFRLGRLAAHLALDGLDVGAGPILRGTRGEPLWPAGVVGSISHLDHQAIAVVALTSAASGIGVDLEDQSRYFDGLAAEITGPEEMQELEALDPAARVRATLEIFSAKESIYKANYPRVKQFFGFDAARIEFAGGGMIGYFNRPLVTSYPTDRPMEIGRQWAKQRLLTWLVLPPE